MRNGSRLRRGQKDNCEVEEEAGTNTCQANVMVSSGRDGFSMGKPGVGKPIRACPRTKVNAIGCPWFIG